MPHISPQMSYLIITKTSSQPYSQRYIYFQSLGPVLLTGALNARTGREADYISSDGDKYINSSRIVVVRIIGTLGKYDQRRL